MIKRKKVTRVGLRRKKEDSIEVEENLKPLNKELFLKNLFGDNTTYNDYRKLIRNLKEEDLDVAKDFQNKFMDEIALVEESGLDRTEDGKFSDRLLQVCQILDMLDEIIYKYDPNYKQNGFKLQTQSEEDGTKMFSRFKIIREDGILLATGCVFSLNKIIVYGLETGIISIYNSLEMVHSVFGQSLGCRVVFIDRAVGTVKDSEILN